MGFFSGGGNTSAIKKWGKFNPPNINVPGFSTSYDITKIGKKKWDANANVNLSPEMQALRDRYLSLTNTSLDSLTQPFTNNGGYGGVSPELLAEFDKSNNVADPTAFYDKAGFDSMLGSNLNLAQLAGSDAASLMANGTEGNMQKWLGILRELSRPEENNLLQGNYDKQFSRGVLGSTAGAYQTQGMTEGLRLADLQRQLQSYGMSQDEINQALSRAASTSAAYTGMEGDAAGRMFNVNNTIGTRAADRFARAAGMFGLGQETNNQDWTRRLQQYGVGAQGQQSIDDRAMQAFMNMIGAGSQQSAANTNAYGTAASLQNQMALGGVSMLNSLISKDVTLPGG